MKLLISAPCGQPDRLGPRLQEAAHSVGIDVLLFDHPASRDPTLELPEVARRHRTSRVVLLAPEREDPATIELVRRAGNRILLWCPPVLDQAPSFLEARRRWISRAADRVAVTEEWMCPRYVDRAGRPAVHQPLLADLGTCLDGLLSNLEE